MLYQILKMAVATFLSCGFLFAKDINIVFVGSGIDADPFWSVVKNGAMDAAKDMGAKVEYRNAANGDRTEMARIIQSAISKRPDGLVVSIADKDALAKDIKRAVDLKIPVINVNSGAEAGKELGALLYIGNSEYQAGLLAGKKAKTEGVKSFICVNHEITNTVLEQRCQGFADGLGVKNNMLDAGFDPSESQKKLEPYLSQVDAILTIGPVSASSTIDLLKKKRMKKYFVTFDLSQEITNAIKDGSIDFAIDQQQYLQGYLPIVFLTQYAKYGVIPANDVYTGPAFVTKSNVDSVQKFAGKYR
ncbi:sugar ABC transporter substrate-binding protein [Helicobacter sp.]|uniref:sugar ABC transporter substrate-binding protein n=1 Tax=Helicobacter sp. TaxID=218 RepID=UPI0025BF426A|nr:sugar ABC transporter substrate-binding protein [Helicobacter sp.]MCI5968337.1 sugar ABC transporter substrate-binding protein [Helicobacter sp.]MDY2584854.1 sugar ABC transporter substrate-binding protein [Helicobacter sp.]